MQIEIYTKDYCPYCHRAKQVLSARGLEYKEYDVTYSPDGQREMRERTGGHTVPQILIDDKPIGGSDELVYLDNAGVFAAEAA